MVMGRAYVSRKRYGSSWRLRVRVEDPRSRISLLALFVSRNHLYFGGAIFASYRNRNDQPDATDSIVTVRALFNDGLGFVCDRAADANADFTIDISDPRLLMQHMFVGGAPSPEPTFKRGRVEDVAEVKYGTNRCTTPRSLTCLTRP